VKSQTAKGLAALPWVNQVIDQPGKHEQQICSRPNTLVQPDGLHVWVHLDEPSPLGDAFAVSHRMGLDGTDPTAWAAKPLV